MPALPSGLVLGLSRDAILEPTGPAWFKCPEGHFWYRTPDLLLTPPPYSRSDSVMEDFVHAPVPSTPAEARRYLRVMLRDPDGAWWWRGEWLSEFPRYTDLDEPDRLAWEAWLDSDGCRAFEAQVLVICRAQAEANRHALGFAVVSTPRPKEP